MPWPPFVISGCAHHPIFTHHFRAMTRALPFALSLFLSAFTITLHGQLSFGGRAFGLMEKGPVLPVAPVAMMPTVDATPLLAEDEAKRQSGSKGPYRFGVNHAVDLGLDNSGVWHEFPNGDRLWRLAVECPGAFSINFEFHDYVIPEGALVFVYNDEGVQLGAFMAGSNPGHSSLGVTQLPGDRITVEYFEPAQVAGQGRLRIGQVTHAYRDVFRRAKDLGDSGDCNINVICPEGDDWRDQIRSVAIITVGGSGFCTGTMLNNCAEDGTPYFLTADHCLDANVTNWVFRWNWESPECEQNLNGPTDQTVSGCELLVNSAGTDVALLRLNTAPPPEYDVFYSGWDKSSTPAERVTGIHHPAGDIKKISHSEDPVIPGMMSGAECWHVQAWDDGTTEPGSSGSGLWNQDKLLVGQLFGGQANCDFNFNDYYGRLDVSWPLLEPWLGSCGDQLPGLGDSGPVGPVTLDAAVTSIVNIPALLCGPEFIVPRVTVKNNGSEVMTSVILLYGLLGDLPQIFPWTGSLLPGQTVNVDLPAVTVTAGEHILVVSSSSPNGMVDQVPENDWWSYSFIVNSPAEEVVLTINADAYGSDITWTLVTDLGTTLYSGGPYANVAAGQTITVPMCLTNGCYTFTINDLFGDGICCANGQGNYNIMNSDGLYYANNDGQYGSQQVDVLCVSGVSVGEIPGPASLVAYPNPSTGELFVELAGVQEQGVLSVVDALGRRVQEHPVSATTGRLSLELGGLANGIYTLSMEQPAGRAIVRVVLQR